MNAQARIGMTRRRGQSRDRPGGAVQAQGDGARLANVRVGIGRQGPRQGAGRGRLVQASQFLGRGDADDGAGIRAQGPGQGRQRGRRVLDRQGLQQPVADLRVGLASRGGTQRVGAGGAPDAAQGLLGGFQALGGRAAQVRPGPRRALGLGRGRGDGARHAERRQGQHSISRARVIRRNTPEGEHFSVQLYGVRRGAGLRTYDRNRAHATNSALEVREPLPVEEQGGWSTL